MEQNEPHAHTSHRSSLREGWESIGATIVILALAPLTAFLLTLFVFQSYQVDGPSMETTLQHSDRLIVFKLPRTIARITGNEYIPKRGDIVVFHRNSVQDYGSSDKQLIKRVIALPGERVIVKDGVLTVFNNEHPKGFRPDAEMEYGKVVGETQGLVDLTVDENEVFVAGDNRGNSMDSRNFGPINVDEIVGKLSYRIFPLDKAQSF